MAHMGVGRAAGKNKAEEATRMAISSPLLETSIDGAKGVIVNITGPMDLSLDDVQVATNMVKEVSAPDALFMFGAAFDETLEDEIKVTVIATGFEGEVKPLPVAPAAPATPVAESISDPEPVSKVESPIIEDPDLDIKPPTPISEEPIQPDPDPFDDIFKIFNKGK